MVTHQLQVRVLLLTQSAIGNFSYCLASLFSGRIIRMLRARLLKAGFLSSVLKM